MGTWARFPFVAKHVNHHVCLMHDVQTMGLSVGRQGRQGRWQDTRTILGVQDVKMSWSSVIFAGT